MVPTALKWSYGVKLMVTAHFDLISGPLRVRRGPKRDIWAQSLNFHSPIFVGIFWPRKTLLRTEEVLRGPRWTIFGPKCPRMACRG